VSDTLYQPTTKANAIRRKELASGIDEGFEKFRWVVFADGALPEKTKQLIAVAAAHVTQCPYCITSHTKLAVRKGATDEEIMEAIWVAAEMRAGGAFAHATIALNAMDHEAHADSTTDLPSAAAASEAVSGSARVHTCRRGRFGEGRSTHAKSATRSSGTSLRTSSPR
jgi:AhpD family alkylhydroperoxidase